MSELAEKRRRNKLQREAIRKLRLHGIYADRANYANVGATIVPRNFQTPLLKISAAPGAAAADVDYFIEALKELMR